MTIESVVIVIVGSAASVFLLTFAWWLWTRAPLDEALEPEPAAAPPRPDARWMGWADPSAPPVQPSAERTLFEQSTLEPVAELNHEAEDIDRARTMFFVKREPDKTCILADGADEDAPASRLDQIPTAANPRAKSIRRPVPPVVPAPPTTRRAPPPRPPPPAPPTPTPRQRDKPSPPPPPPPPPTRR